MSLTEEDQEVIDYLVEKLVAKCKNIKNLEEECARFVVDTTREYFEATVIGKPKEEWNDEDKSFMERVNDRAQDLANKLYKINKDDKP